MDARRLRLYELLKPKLDEEPARELVLALPSRPSELVTKDDLAHQLVALEARVVDRLTWRMITIMGAWSVIVSSAWAAALAIIG
ncbi:MAG: hypothetical protein ACRDKJ_14615 [Actinomycetota bacterium]